MQIELVANTRESFSLLACAVLCRAMIVKVANERPSWWPYRLVGHRFVGAPLAGEHRVRLDGFVRAGQAGCLDELAEQLAAEQPVALEQIGPQVGHIRECKRSSSTRRT
jgi:hypothetical protein